MSKSCSGRERMYLRLPLLALIAMPLDAVGADAADPNSGTQIFAFSGFGTVGAVHSSEDKADFTSSIFKPNGAGYTQSWSAAVDSLIGAQLSATITPKLSAVVQIIAEQNYDNSYTPHVEWANLKYQFTPDFSVRIGRAVLPTFLFSDTRKVGYTYPWVRPPIEVYSLFPLSDSDGADFQYRLHIGDVTNTLLGTDVQSEAQQPNNRGNSIARDSFGFSNTTEYESLTFRVSYQHARLTIRALDPFFDAFREFGPQGIAIANKYDSDSKAAVVEVVGASYDPGHWFVVSELGHSSLNSFLGTTTAWYASVGYRAGTFTPYVTYAQETAASNFDPGLTVTGLPPALSGIAAGLNAGLNAVLESIPARKTASIGLRWDFMKNLDLKLQFDHSRNGTNSSGGLTNLQPGFQLGGTVNLFSATIDFVF
jgi:hypothetical protein